MFNPPVVNAELGIRASYVKQAVMLATDLVRAQVPTIVFGQSRNNVEVMLRYLRDKVAPDIDASRIMGYRGGYLPEQRREIERKLRAGEVLDQAALDKYSFTRDAYLQRRGVVIDTNGDTEERYDLPEASSPAPAR